jgi:predicted methyltransferase
LAINQANSVNSLSTDIYTDRIRFVFELLQNADDASAQLINELFVSLRFVGNYLVFAHKGKPLSENDVDAITAVGQSGKRTDIKSTGFKGMGFKSVFGVSKKVFILSGDYSFRFEEVYWADYWDSRWGAQAT